MAFDLHKPRLLIGADWTAAMDSYDVVDPFTGDTVARVPQGDASLLDRAVAVAHGAFSLTRAQPAFERAAVLHRAAAIVERRTAQFVDTIVAEAGKPIVLAEAEVSRAVMTLTASAEAARQPNGQALDVDAFASGAGHFGLTRRFPLGVIYAITPFNFPLNLVAHKLGPAIATGNTVVLKPAPRTPLSSLMLADALLEAGIIRGQVNVVTCPNDLAGRLLADERVRMISFTGSAKVGWGIRQQSPMKRVVLELGGNAPAIVEPDADLDLAVALLATGGFAYAGQSCIHTQRIYVHQDIYDTFRDRYVAQVRETIKTGDPRDRDVLVGPLIDRAAVTRVAAWVDAAVERGATVLTGGKAAGAIYEPTVLENVDPAEEVVCNEVFGPVVVLAPYATFDQAIALANDSRFGIHAGVFTRDLGKAITAFERLEFGGVLINQAPTFRVETMPYGGVKESGVGREGVRYTMDDMTELKALVIKS